MVSGVPGSVLDCLKQRGFVGIEASLSDLGSTPSARRETVRRLAERRMHLVCGVYSSWVDYEVRWDSLHASPSEQLKTLEGQLRDVVDVVSGSGHDEVLVHVNAHAGGDGWDECTSATFFADAAGLEDLLPRCANNSARRKVTLSYETHRGRPLGGFFAAARLCERVESLRLTLDYSHWVVGAERLVGVGVDSSSTEGRLLDALLERVDHVHARVGSPQSPQLPVEGGPLGWAACRDAHADVWRRCWLSQMRRGAAHNTATPEYGPPPEYTPVNLLGEPLYDSDKQIDLAVSKLRHLHSEMHHT